MKSAFAFGVILILFFLQNEAIGQSCQDTVCYVKNTELQQKAETLLDFTSKLRSLLEEHESHAKALVSSVGLPG